MYSSPDPSSFPLSQVDSQIASAFALWASVTDLTFTERSYGAVHMDISFHSRSGGRQKARSLEEKKWQDHKDMGGSSSRGRRRV